MTLCYASLFIGKNVIGRALMPQNFYSVNGDVLQRVNLLQKPSNVLLNNVKQYSVFKKHPANPNFLCNMESQSIQDNSIVWKCFSMTVVRMSHAISQSGKRKITTKVNSINFMTKRNKHILKNSPNTVVDKAILQRYTRLGMPKDKFQATYLWIDGTGENMRLKDRILTEKPKSPEDLPTWQYDGSSTYQAQGQNSDITLIPVAIYKDPFKIGKDDIIVMCDTKNSEGKILKNNSRALMLEAYCEVEDQEPWFGIEQEYTLLDVNGKPFGWPDNGFPLPQGPYYCGVGADKVYGRDLAEAHAIACLYAGIDFAGTNYEVMPAQWEYQVGPSLGMKCADDLWVSRYILQRIGEELGIVVTFDPKPMTGPWNGAGGHCNFSTKAMRADGGMKAIEAAIEKLSHKQKEHIAVYDPKGGQDNMRRLLGRLETSSIDKFTSGIANRGASVRISRGVADAGKGYLEDRRPTANADPYAVCNALLRTCLLGK